MTTPISRQDEFASIKRHRKQTRRLIYFPILLVAIFLLVLIFAFILPASPLYMAKGGYGLSIMADFALMCFGLVPMMICCGMIYFALFAGIYLMNSAQRKSANGLRKVQGLSRDMVDKTGEYGDKISQQSIKLNSRFAFLQPILGIFDPPKEKDGETTDDTHE